MNAATAFRPLRQRTVLIFLGFLVVCRVLLLFTAPQTDPSESRYAEISRKMVETHDWVTPQFDYGVPFWAKPPLSMWMSALGIQWFGANDFGARIFIFVAALGVVAVVIQMGREEFGRAQGLAAGAMLMGMPLFFYCSGAVMTDLPLVAGTTLAMAGFRLAVKRSSKGWGYVFFLGLAIGLLAKGPLVAVIALPPICLWLLLSKQRKRVLESIPWLGGLLLMVAIAVPWYLLAERRTPGFLDYFLIGEHWRRFTVKGWRGDLYGRAHEEPFGMVWIYWLLMTFPWCLGIVALPFRRWRESRSWLFAEDARGLYLLSWALWPLIFFSASRNIIITYPLPALPALALLLSGLVAYRTDERRGAPPGKGFHPFHPMMRLACAALIAWAVSVSTLFPAASPKSSERELVKRFDEEKKAGDLLLYFGSRKLSAEFYSGGHARHTRSIPELWVELGKPGRLFLAMPARKFAALPPQLRARFTGLDHAGSEQALYAEILTPSAAGKAISPKNPVKPEANPQVQ